MRISLLFSVKGYLQLTASSHKNNNLSPGSTTYLAASSSNLAASSANPARTWCNVHEACSSEVAFAVTGTRAATQRQKVCIPQRCRIPRWNRYPRLSVRNLHRGGVSRLVQSPAKRIVSRPFFRIGRYQCCSGADETSEFDLSSRRFQFRDRCAARLRYHFPTAGFWVRGSYSFSLFSLLFFTM